LDQSAAILSHQVAGLVPDMFSNFYLVKNHKIVKNPTIIEARGKSTDLESLYFLALGSTELKIIKFYIIKLAIDLL
jgi:hypothetical protein